MFNPEAPPALQTSRWFNAPDPLSLEGELGRVVMITVFQALCPASLNHALPQAQRIANRFNNDEVTVIGLHAPFENQDKQTPGAVETLIKERNLTIPIAIDKPNVKKLPRTFASYELHGTPTTLLFDRQSRLRRCYLGQVDDLRLGAEIMAYTLEPRTAPRETSIAIEQALAMALVEPEHHEHGENCGCGHDHSHDHGHHHHHDHDQA